MPELQATIVFQKHWDAIHERNPDGSRKYRYILHRGSSRSSKTRSLITSHYLEALQHRSWRISVWRSTKKDCRDTVGKDMSVVYPSMPQAERVLFNKTEAIYQFGTGSVIELCGTDEPNRIHGYNGDVAHLNEPYDMSKETFDQIDMRVSEYITLDLNPKQGHWSDELEKDPRTLVIRSTFKDNPFCPEEQKKKILSYQPVKMCEIVEKKLLQEVEAKAYNITENPLNFTEKQLIELSRCKENERKGSASAFNWSVYGLGEKAEKPNRIFFWSEIPDDDYHKIDAKRYYASDWGVVDPWAVLEGKYYDGALYLHEKNYASENEIKATLTIHEIESVNQTEEGLIGWYFNRINIPKNEIIVCDNNRPGKVLALRNAGYEYAITAQKGQGSVIDGISSIEKMKVYYTSSSKNLAYEQENYERKVDRYGIVLEEPEDKDNHLIDDARYIVSFLKAQQIIKTI